MADSYQTPSAASTLDELLAHHDQAFVHVAYLAVMGREPDPEGLRYYTARLRSGHAKLSLLDQLARSKEARSRVLALPGLKRALARHRRGQWPLLGAMWRLIEGTEGNSPRERRERALLQEVARLREESQLRLSALEASLAQLPQVLARLPAATGGTVAAGTPAPAMSPELRLLSSMSPRVRPVFVALQTAVAQQQAQRGQA